MLMYKPCPICCHNNNKHRMNGNNNAHKSNKQCGRSTTEGVARRQFWLHVAGQRLLFAFLPPSVFFLLLLVIEMERNNSVKLSIALERRKHKLDTCRHTETHAHINKHKQTVLHSHICFGQRFCRLRQIAQATNWSLTETFNTQEIESVIIHKSLSSSILKLRFCINIFFLVKLSTSAFYLLRN